jgi:hypothetical protein
MDCYYGSLEIYNFTLQKTTGKYTNAKEDSQDLVFYEVNLVVLFKASEQFTVTQNSELTLKHCWRKLQGCH